jgi:hypothetical protein
MVKVHTLLKHNDQFNQLEEHDQVKRLVAQQVANHLQGGYVEKLLETLTTLHNRKVGSALVGSALVGSGSVKRVRCNQCAGKGFKGLKKLNQVCTHCQGSGLMEWINKGVNFISSLFGKKNDDIEQQEPEQNFDYDYDTKPKQAYNKKQEYKAKEPENPDFLVHGEQRTQLLKELGLSKNATKADVRKAYIKLSLKYHPDKGGDEEMFKRLANIKTELIGGELPSKKKESVVGTKEEVFNGLKKRTSGGLMKSDLMKNKKNKIVSKKQYQAGQNAYLNLEKYRK